MVVVQRVVERRSQGGKELVEIDKLNFICTIAGTDYLAQVRGDLGME